MSATGHLWTALPPKVLEPIRRQLGVAHRVLDVFMPEIGLQRPRIMALFGQSEAASMAQHVRMRSEFFRRRYGKRRCIGRSDDSIGSMMSRDLIRRLFSPVSPVPLA